MRMLNRIPWEPFLKLLVKEIKDFLEALKKIHILLNNFLSIPHLKSYVVIMLTPGIC